MKGVFAKGQKAMSGRWGGEGGEDEEGIWVSSRFAARKELPQAHQSVAAAVSQAPLDEQDLCIWSQEVGVNTAVPIRCFGLGAEGPSRAAPHLWRERCCPFT